MGQVIRILRFIAARALGDPVREGRLAENPASPWPPGLRLIVVAVVGLFVLLTVSIAGAQLIRRTPLVANRDGSLPWLVIPVLALAIAVALSLLYAAALHVWWVWRLPLLALVLISLLAAARTDELVWLVITLIGLAVLIALAAVRWRSRFSVWEFVISLAVIGNLILVQFAGPALRAVDVEAWPVLVVTEWTMLLTYLATPAILLAAAGMTELVITTGSWTARGVWEGTMGRPAGRLVGALALAGLVVWSMVQEVWLLATDSRRPVSELPLAAAIMVVTGAAAAAVLRLAPRGERPGVAVDADDVADAYSGVSWALAVVLAVWLVAPVLSSALLSLGLPDLGNLADAVVLAAVGLLIAVGLSRRGRPAAALIATAFAVEQLAVQIGLALGLTTASTHLVTVSALAAVGLAVWLLVRRRLTADRALAIGTVLLLTRLYEFRETLDDPISALLAVSG
ncbi:MAG: hypothetical protein Q4F67_03220, partial [Propionibacteriaceae bacterium]|nr:hypothetical protein [Propionibacteriaceae bacterium]